MTAKNFILKELLITNARLYQAFWPLDNKRVQVRIREGKIASIESNGENPGKAEIFDARDKTLCASFKDSHLHLLRYGLMKQELDLRRIKSWKQLKELLRDENERQELKTNDWLVGRGLTDDHFEDRQELLAAKDLDETGVDRPIFLLHEDGHECVLNSAALNSVKEKENLEKITHKDFIEKDDKGKWTGRFKDAAVHFIKMNFRSKSVDEAKEALGGAIPHLAELGITSVDTDDLNYVGDYDKVWQAYTELDKEIELPFRAYLHHYVYRIDDMKKYLKNNKLRSGEGEGNVRVGAFKIFTDGTYRLHTAAVNFPYEDADTSGTLIYSQDELNEMMKLAEENKMQVTMHCVGDKAVETAAIAIMKANPGHRNPMRHRIIHMQNTRPDLMKMLAEYRIPIETQPAFLMKEWPNYAKRLGDYRSSFVQLGKSLVDNGLIFTSSSDAPISPLNPQEQIFAAVNRTDESHQPEGGWNPKEKMSVDEAYHSYCHTPCYLNFSDELTGRLFPGYQADLMLLDQHPLEMEKKRLHQLKVDTLLYKGRIIFDRYGEHS